MILSIYYVVECQHRHLRADAATLRRLHHELAAGLLCVNGTFTAGFLAGRPWGDRRHINAICFMVSTASFYSMLGCIDRMLGSTQEFAKAHMPALSWQFAVTRNAVFLVCHLLPIAWLQPYVPQAATLRAQAATVCAQAATLCAQVWHLFPIVWALAAADAITVEVEHMGCAAVTPNP